MADNNEEIIPESGAEVARGYTKIHLATKRLMFNNFMGGLAWGFGTVLGATIVVALVLFILNQLDTVPFIGDFINNINEQIQINQTPQW